MILERPNCFGRVLTNCVGQNSICFGQVQIILVMLKSDFFGLIFFNLDLIKTNWTSPKRLVLNQNDFDGPK
jgi:hypothetical protein